MCTLLRILSMALFGFAPAVGAAAAKPNVVVIFIDDLGSGPTLSLEATRNRP